MRAVKLSTNKIQFLTGGANQRMVDLNNGRKTVVGSSVFKLLCASVILEHQVNLK